MVFSSRFSSLSIVPSSHIPFTFRVAVRNPYRGTNATVASGEDKIGASLQRRNSTPLGVEPTKTVCFMRQEETNQKTEQKKNKAKIHTDAHIGAGLREDACACSQTCVYMCDNHRVRSSNARPQKGMERVVRDPFPSWEGRVGWCVRFAFRPVSRGACAFR